MGWLRLYNSGVTQGVIGTMTDIQQCRIYDCGWSQANVDAFLADIYAHRADFTYAAPTLQIGGTNAAPSGVYQNVTPPTTGKEYIFKLQTDPDNDFANHWVITYTGSP